MIIYAQSVCFKKVSEDHSEGWHELKNKNNNKKSVLTKLLYMSTSMDQQGSSSTTTSFGRADEKGRVSPSGHRLPLSAQRHQELLLAGLNSLHKQINAPVAS